MKFLNELRVFMYFELCQELFSLLHISPSLFTSFNLHLNFPALEFFLKKRKHQIFKYFIETNAFLAEAKIRN